MKSTYFIFQFYKIFGKLSFFLDSSHKKTLYRLLFLLVIGMFLEAISFSIIIPVLSIIIDPQFKLILSEFELIDKLIENKSQVYLVSMALFSLIIIFFSKALFLIYLTFFQNNFVAKVSAHVSNNLMGKYLKANFNFHQENNSSLLHRNLHTEVTLFTNLLRSYLNILVEIILLISILLTLIFIDPIGAFSIGFIFAVFSYLFLSITKKKLSKLGSERQDLDGKLSNLTLESMRGIKEIKISGIKDYFLKKFSERTNYRANINASFISLNLIPRFYLELVSIISLSGFIFFYLLRGGDTESLITVVGVFIAAIFRLLPSINKIISGLQTIKYNMYSLDLLTKEFKSTPTEKIIEGQSEISFKNKLEIKNLSFSYQNQGLILDSVNVSIKRGETIGIVGPSGSGKTTLLNLILGLYSTKLKSIYIDGQPIKSTEKWRNIIGYVPQSIFLLDDSIRNNISFGRNTKNDDQIKIINALKIAELDSFVNRLPEGLETNVGEQGGKISGGQKQRIGLARALYDNPEVLIFDEATSALDNQTEAKIIKSILKLKGTKTIIMVAHRLTSLEGCDRIFNVKNKKVNLIESKEINKINV